jgi:4'-phosphopantetheinyl transferase
MPASADSNASWIEWPGCNGLGDNPGAVHVFRIALPAAGTIVPATFPELSPDEIRRAERYVVEAPRRQFVATRVAVRRLLGEWLSVDPRDVAFEFAQFGKPRVAAAQNRDGLVFNVTHSGSWAVIAIGWQRSLGVDVETFDPRLNRDGLAGRFFSLDEQSQLAALPEPLRVAAFYRIWTTKEAYLKATGLGMSQPLDSFSVRADPQSPPAVLWASGDDADPARWHGTAFSPGEDAFGVVLWDGDPANVRWWNGTAV